MRIPKILLAFVLPLAACGTDPGSSSDDLSQAGKALIGEYLEQGRGAFRGLVLTNEAVTGSSNRFFADIDTGIVCITAPCPSMERVEGTFSAGSQYLTLKSTSASEMVQQYLGRYRYSLVDGKLSLKREGFEQSLESVPSYCAPETVEADCGVTAKDLALPQCLGYFTCSDGGTCDWNCSTDSDCGGFLGLTCGEDEYCDYEPSQMCGAGDQMGSCKAKPDVCPLACPAPEYQVCGCDGQLYCSECDAQRAGVDVTGQTGNCGAEPKDCGGFAGFTCGEDEYCDYEPSEMCGAADQMGTCKPRPEVCPLGCPAPEYQPCGCDGQLYCNECEANRAGVSITDQTGTCN